MSLDGYSCQCPRELYRWSHVDATQEDARVVVLCSDDASSDALEAACPALMGNEGKRCSMGGDVADDVLHVGGLQSDEPLKMLVDGRDASLVLRCRSTTASLDDEGDEADARDVTSITIFLADGSRGLIDG